MPKGKKVLSEAFSRSFKKLCWFFCGGNIKFLDPTPPILFLTRMRHLFINHKGACTTAPATPDLWWTCQQSEGGSVKTCPEAKGRSPRADGQVFTDPPKLCWQVNYSWSSNSMLEQFPAVAAAVVAESCTTKQVCKVLSTVRDRNKME